MTGLGRGNSESGGAAITVEIRSVNHRFLDLKIRGTSLLPKHEEALRKRIGRVITRGSLSVSVRRDLHDGSASLAIDFSVAERVHSDLLAVSESLGLTEPIPLTLICQQPGVMVSCPAKEEDEAALGVSLLEAADEALAELLSMRDAEGASLLADIEVRLETLRRYAEQIAGLAGDAPRLAQKRLEDRISKLLKNSNIEVDEERVALEVAVLADKLDISEELVRLRSHFEQLALLAHDRQPAGRRLDFLVQELGREFNTVTSKSQSAHIAGLVVEAKAELEKIREQVQNVE